MVDNLLHELESLAAGNDEYASFNQRIVNTRQTVLGVRVPDMRRLAKRRAQTVTVAEMKELLTASSSVFEVVFVTGLLLSHAKFDDEVIIRLTRCWLGQVDSWAQIDAVAQRRPRYQRTAWQAFVRECLASADEMTVRFGVVVLMTNYLGADTIHQTLELLRRVRHNGYYVRTALAWTYATAAVEHFTLTLDELASGHLDPWVVKKSYQKMRESRRFTAEQQEVIQRLRASLSYHDN